MMSYDYTGYGISNPEISSENEIYEDISFVASFAVEKLKYHPKKIILWGFSLGAAPAFHIASLFEFGAVIAGAPFISINAWLHELYSFKALSERKNSDKFPNYSKILKIKCPILIYHGLEDKVINVNHSRFLKQIYNDFSMEPAQVCKSFNLNLESNPALKNKARGVTYSGKSNQEPMSGKVTKPLTPPARKDAMANIFKEGETQKNEKKEGKGDLLLLELEKLDHGDIQEMIREGHCDLTNHILSFISRVMYQTFNEESSIVSPDLRDKCKSSEKLRKIYNNAFVNIHYDQKLKSFIREVKKEGNNKVEADSHIKSYIKCTPLFSF